MTEKESIWVDLRPLSTGREHCLTLRTGPIDPDTIQQAETSRFDQLPVLDDSARLCGLIATKRARQLLDAGDELDPVAHKLDFRIFTQTVDLFDLLGAFEDHRAVIFRRDEDDAASDDDWFALVTISDLNRHPFRSRLYPILAELESALAELIDRHFKHSDEWLSVCSEDARARILNMWQLAIRNRVDISPITGCTLIDMINIVKKSAALCLLLGFSSQSAYKKATGSLSDLRNQILHPVRPLILDQHDVHKLQETLDVVLRLTERAATPNAVSFQGDNRSSQLLP